MRIYANLIILGLIGIALSAYISFQIFNPNVSFVSILLSYMVVLLTSFLLTKKEMEDYYTNLIRKMKTKYHLKIRKIKREHDTATLERTIRNGTQTLIKNAVDYFKIDNIKNEMGSTAAIQNLQLDKYGQIIELLADFSLILPDHEENRKIVQQEIHHQIEIYRFDEMAFAHFLERIMEKYRVTFNKKLREKEALNGVRRAKICPQCAEKIAFEARECGHCGFNLRRTIFGKKSMISDPQVAESIRKGCTSYRQGEFEEAIKIFTQAIENNPKAGHAYYNRGIAYMKLDNEIQALDDLKTAAEMGHPKANKVLHVLRMMKTQEWNAFS